MYISLLALRALREVEGQMAEEKLELEDTTSVVDGQADIESCEPTEVPDNGSESGAQMDSTISIESEPRKREEFTIKELWTLRITFAIMGLSIFVAVPLIWFLVP